MEILNEEISNDLRKVVADRDRMMAEMRKIIVNYKRANKNLENNPKQSYYKLLKDHTRQQLKALRHEINAHNSQIKKLSSKLYKLKKYGKFGAGLAVGGAAAYGIKTAVDKYVPDKVKKWTKDKFMGKRKKLKEGLEEAVINRVTKAEMEPLQAYKLLRYMEEKYNIEE